MSAPGAFVADVKEIRRQARQRYFGDKDPTTRVVLERILAQEEEHANDMHDLLQAGAMRETPVSSPLPAASR